MDLVATTKDGEFHAIQCKLYDADRKVSKSEIDSFLSAASKTYFSRRIIVSTTHAWSDNALATLENQDPPVTKIDLETLEQSAIDWLKFAEKKEVVLKPKKQLRDHQKAALTNVQIGLYEQGLERGKLIMACGTGKTFTSLKIAEACAGKGKRVLFLVPSLSLLSQTLTEWTQESATPLHSYAVCSDTEVGKKKNATAIDAVTTLEHELQYPATTDAKKLAENVEKHHDDEHMTVVFSTYHSINTVSDAQNDYQMGEFDLIICDEAHRTTGSTHDSEDDSNFVKIHDGGFILGKKRLYMTATPRIFSDDVKDKATDFTLYSMDNEKLFGETLYTINFSEAVIQVIVGNPPYSAGQDSANDNNANVKYPALDDKIRQTYADRSVATNKNALYDSYIRAIRWASDRIATQGVIGFVTNAGWIDANTADGLRKCLVEEFSSLYIFHLCGNARTSGEQRRKEKDNVFGQGTRTPIAISLLVKNSKAEQQGQIYFHDIGDYLSREEKLEKIAEFKSLQGIAAAKGWTTITPDEHGDWINQRDDSFGEFISIGDKKDKTSKTLFDIYSGGVKTNRDAWCYNTSKQQLSTNISNTLQVYEQQRLNLLNGSENVIYNPKLISWSGGLEDKVRAQMQLNFDKKQITKAMYRPFYKLWLYYDKNLNERRYLMPKLFPTEVTDNVVMYLSGSGNSGKDFSVLIVDQIPDLNMQHSGGQGFPLYLYEEVINDKKVGSSDLFDNSLDLTVSETKYKRKDGISDEGLQHFQAAYPNEQITKEDIFYYTYGLLHSEEYRERYADNLTKELPRIPCVKKAEDFWAFSKAGRELAHWHLNYETVEPYKATLDTGTTPYSQLTANDFRIEKMKFAKKGEKGTVIYNKRVTIKDIPLEAYEYVVNGKPALEWVMERQGVSTHKDSGIVNDANDWAIETMNNAAYPLELFLRVITVSLETMKIVKALPKLDI
ncbi:type ISP restriction/modification enzyme [Acinetobacter junii]|uniref:type ISP restriction/modification enzyme n=1 Tax=Acinetobacter junii TaxID=40215 RepID=UPI000B3C644E|nr:type ISP restriction/modification enzyme [Acinetobacter junii]AWA47087.1 hypothetical protein CDG57_03175 [Acinetobacter junii]